MSDRHGISDARLTEAECLTLLPTRTVGRLALVDDIVEDRATINRVLGHRELQPWIGGVRSMVVRVRRRAVAGRHAHPWATTAVRTLAAA